MLNKINKIIVLANESVNAESIERIKTLIYNKIPEITLSISYEIKNLKIRIKDIDIGKIEPNLNLEDSTCNVLVEIVIEYFGEENSDFDEKLNLAASNYAERLRGFTTRIHNTIFNIDFKYVKKWVGPASNRYYFDVYDKENISLENQFKEALDSGIFNNYKKFIRYNLSVSKKGGNGYIFHGGSFKRTGFINIKYPQGNRLTTTDKTNSYFNSIIDFFPAWKKFPKRSNSIMFTTVQNQTKTYGETFVAFFPDDAKVGVAPYRDIWASTFKYGSGANTIFFSPVSFGQFLDYINSNYRKRKIRKDTVENFFNDLSEINEIIHKEGTAISTLINDSELNEFRNILNYIRHNHINLIDLINDAFDPARGNFTLTTTSRIIKNIQEVERHEMWIDRPCLLVLYSSINQFNDLVEKYKIV